MCIAAIPGMNALADKVKDEPVQFIAITAEDEVTVKKFVAKRPIHAWIALDTDKAMNQAYAVGAIPHTVLPDQSGKIAAITQPTMALEQHIKDLLAGKKLDMFPRTYPPIDGDKKSKATFGPVIERTLRIDGNECDFPVFRSGGFCAILTSKGMCAAQIHPPPSRYFTPQTLRSPGQVVAGCGNRC